MSNISGITGKYTDYGKIASGNKLPRAADGAAELAVATKLNTQAAGQSAGAQNVQAGKSMLNVADSGLAGIADYLQRIKEIGIKASNTAVYSAGDRAIMQSEVDQLKAGIADAVKQTTYNEKNLLDGSNKDMDFAIDSNGNKISANLPQDILSQLGISDFDVTGDFDLKTIDSALERVSSARGSIGAQTNAMDYAYNYLNSGSQYQTASASELEDLDIEKAVSEMKKNQTLDMYRIMMQKKQQENEAGRTTNLFQSI